MTEVQKNGPQYLRERDEARAEADALRKRLREYEGWSPHQFTNLLSEHRQLQRNYLKLDQEKVELRQEVERLWEAITNLLALMGQACTEVNGVSEITGMMVEGVYVPSMRLHKAFIDADEVAPLKDALKRRG